MDILDIMFNKKRPFAPINISGGTTNGRISAVSQPTFVQCLDASEKEMLEDDVQISRQKVENNIKTTIRTNDDFGGYALDDHDTDVYTKYKFDRRSQTAAQLPVWHSKDKILSKITQYPTVVIEGSTGCGKSTQASK